MEEYKVQPRGLFVESRRYEIHEGKIYNMAGASVPHGNVVGNVFMVFKNYLKGKKCKVFGENVNVVFDKSRREYMPDIKIVCDPNKIKNDNIQGAPDLIVEVLSPKTKKNDIGYKKDIYEQYGVKEYWIVSPKERSIEVYLLKDNVFKLDNVYQVYHDYEFENLTDEEKNEVQMEFKTSLFDDLIIKVDDVFENVE